MLLVLMYGSSSAQLRGALPAAHQELQRAAALCWAASISRRWAPRRQHPTGSPYGLPAGTGPCPCATLPSGPLVCTHRWQRRITAMSTARRAFLKALHLGPASAAAWGDVAATFYHEAQLRRSHPSFQPQKGDQLRSTAQRLLTGRVLRLWGCWLPGACLHRGLPQLCIWHGGSNCWWQWL